MTCFEYFEETSVYSSKHIKINSNKEKTTNVKEISFPLLPVSEQAPKHNKKIDKSIFNF